MRACEAGLLAGVSMADGRTKFANQLNEFSKSKRVRSVSIMYFTCDLVD